jgi:predicted Zn-dependent protease
MNAAAEEFARAYHEVGDKYPSVSNKYALALLALRRLDEAERVLQASLRVHPGSAATQVHLGRIYLTRGDAERAKNAFLEALASDPFDPEIHLSLTRVGELLHDAPLAARARQASALLTGLSAEEVERAVGRLGGTERDLTHSAVPPLLESGAAPDGGPPASPRRSDSHERID